MSARRSRVTRSTISTIWLPGVALCMGLAACDMTGGKVRAKALAQEAAERAAADSATRAAAAGGGKHEPLDMVVRTTVVTQTHGMRSEIRWALSPDRSAILAIEDPSGAENDPVPNGFVFARDGWGVRHEERVWDVAPSPDWRWLAYGVAYTVNGRGDSVSVTDWRDVAHRSGVSATALASGSFPSSGMSMSRSYAQPVLEDIATYTAAQEPPEGTKVRRLSFPGGWRVRWAADGSVVAYGGNPAHATDDSDSPTWTTVRPQHGITVGENIEDPSYSPAQWVEGPRLEAGASANLAAATLHAESYDIESRDGVIQLVMNAAGGKPLSKRVMEGTVLAATRSGRYVLALVPRRSAQAGEIANELVLLELVPRRS
jgi:hypothetical protein